MDNLQTIDFHGDEITGVRDENTGKVFVNIRGICESLGMNFSGQYTKLTSDPAYSEGLVRLDIQTSFGVKEALFLDSEFLQGWLFSIQTSRLKPEIRDKHTLYKKEAFKALHDHFTQGFSLNERAFEQFPDVVLDKLSERISERLNAEPPPARFEERMAMYNKVFEVFGKPDKDILSILRDQAVAEVAMTQPAVTMKEADMWYAHDYFSVEKGRGWIFQKSVYNRESSFVQAFGRCASTVARQRGFKIHKQNEVIRSGRIVEVNIYPKECPDIAFKKMIQEGKVVRK